MIHSNIKFFLMLVLIRHYPGRIFRSVPKLCIMHCKVCQLFASPFIHCNIIYRPYCKKITKRLTIQFSADINPPRTYLSECVLVHFLMPRVVILFNKTKILVTFSLQSWLPSVHAGWKVTLAMK